MMTTFTIPLSLSFSDTFRPILTLMKCHSSGYFLSAILFVISIIPTASLQAQFSYLSAGAGQENIQQQYAIDWTLGQSNLHTGTIRKEQQPKKLEQSINAFPNPASSHINLDIPHPFREKVITIQITDQLNRIVKRERRDFAMPRERLSLDNLPAGIYLVQLLHADHAKSESIKIIKTGPSQNQ